MLLMVFLSNERIDTNNNELQFKKWLVDTTVSYTHLTLPTSQYV